MTLRDVLIPCTLLMGLGLSIASSGTSEEDFSNESLERGPTVALAPGQTATFRLHFLAPVGAPSNNNLLLELMERPVFEEEDSGIILDSGMIIDTGAVDTGALSDTGGSTDTGLIFDTGSATDTGTPVTIKPNVHLRLVAGDRVVMEGQPERAVSRDVASLRWYGILDACSHLGNASLGSLTPWNITQDGRCEGTITLEMTVDKAEQIYWGARLQAMDTYVPCDANGEPVGCAKEEPDPTVMLEILPA